MKKRVLFMIDGCVQCRIWKSIIHRFNTKLPIDKRILTIDCTKYYDFGVIEHPLIRIYSPYIKGSFPTLFFEGEKVDSASTREEVEAWLTTRLYEEFIIPEHNHHMFTKSCKFNESKVLGKRVECN